MGLVVALVAGSATSAHSVVPSPPLLPRTVPHLPRHEDGALEESLESLGESFDGWAAIWVQDLRTGSYAGWNADASFPAASTVKIAAMAEGIRKFGFGPESPIESDLLAIGSWSSNDAANHIFNLVGGRKPTEAALLRLGMFSSTYPLAYEVPAPVRKKASARNAPNPPPHNHTRVTTARDLARAFFRLQAAAAGQSYAIKDIELSSDAARAELGFLALDRDDSKLLTFPTGARVAEKDGWLDDVRNTAALVFLPSGPKIVVVLTYRPGLRLSESQALGAEVSKLAFR